MRRWALVVADFRREYAMDATELAGLSVAHFGLLVQGLSDRSRFRRTWADEPRNLYDPDEIAAVKAAARR